MDKRQDKRVKTRQIVKIGGKQLGVVNDISYQGVQISTSYLPMNRKINFLIENNGRVIEVDGIIQWLKKKQRVQALNEMGVVIKNASQDYMDFVRQCHVH